jgi:cell division septation protein DedD
MKREGKNDGRKVFMVLSLLILGGLIFGAGIMVGQRVVQCPEAPSADPLKQLDNISARAPIDSRTLSFPEALSGPRPKPPRRPEVTAPASSLESGSEGRQQSESAEQKEKPAVANGGAKPSASVNGSAKPSAPVNGAWHYSMQVASYRERSQAQALVDRLVKKGYPSVRVVEGTASEKGVVYRVRVGHFASRDDAASQKEKVVREENLSVLIVSEE